MAPSLQFCAHTRTYIHTHKHTHRTQHTHTRTHAHILNINTLKRGSMVLRRSWKNKVVATRTHRHTHTYRQTHRHTRTYTHTHAHTLNVCNGSSTLKIVPVAHLAGFFENTCVSVCTRVCVCTRQHIHHTPTPTASLMKSPSYLEFFGVSTFI